MVPMGRVRSHTTSESVWSESDINKALVTRNGLIRRTPPYCLTKFLSCTDRHSGHDGGEMKPALATAPELVVRSLCCAGLLALLLFGRNLLLLAV